MEQQPQCFWENGSLIVRYQEATFRVPSVAAVKALKRNYFDPAVAEAVGEIGTSPAPGPLFEPDSPRRMSLIQEQLSGLRD